MLQLAFDQLAEAGAREQEGMHVDVVGIERPHAGSDAAVINRDQGEVDVGAFPDAVVGEAAAEQYREDAAIAPQAFEERFEGAGEPFLDRVAGHLTGRV